LDRKSGGKRSRKESMQKHNSATCITARKIVLACVLLSVIAAMEARGGLPIIFEYGPGRNKVALKFFKDAQAQLKAGEVENARRSIRLVALGRDPLIPVVIRMCRILHFNYFQPGILPRGLVKVGVDADVTFHKRLIGCAFRKGEIQKLASNGNSYRHHKYLRLVKAPPLA